LSEYPVLVRNAKPEDENPILGKFRGKINFLAPVIFCIRNLQLSLRSLSKIARVSVGYLQLSAPPIFLRAKAGTAVARLSHRNSDCPSVCLFVTRVDQSKMVQARITESSLSAAWKTLVSGSIKLFRKFKRGHPQRGH